MTSPKVKSVRIAFDEVKGIVFRTTTNLINAFPLKGRAGAELRYGVGDLNAYLARYITDGTFANRLLSVFRLATTAGITLIWMDRVIKSLFEEKPKTLEGILTVENSLVFAIAQEARIIGATKYKSRDEVERVMANMKKWFDATAILSADSMANPNYLAFVDMAGAISRYLADVGRPLPRMIDIKVPPWPTFVVSQYIYGEGDRSEELIAENKIVHPLFCKPKLRGLSA